MLVGVGGGVGAVAVGVSGDGLSDAPVPGFCAGGDAIGGAVVVGLVVVGVGCVTRVVPVGC